MSSILRIEPEFEEMLAAAGLRKFEDFMRMKSIAPATSKHAARETVPVEIVQGGAARRFYLKRVFRVPASHAYGPLFRFQRADSQPAQEWTMLGELTASGIPAMRRVAFGEKRILGAPKKAFLLVEEVPIAHNLEDWFIQGFNRPGELSCAARRRLVFALGSLVGRLQRERFAWPDMHAKHIYAADEDGAGRRWRFALIDVERMQRLSRPAIEHSADGNPEMAKPFRSDLRRFEKCFLASRLNYSDYLCFVAGYWRVALDAPTQKRVNRPSRRAGISAWELRPRLPDDFVHPRSLSTTRHGRIWATREGRELLEANQLGTIDDVFAMSNGASLTKPGLDAHRDRIRLELKRPEGGQCVCYLKRYRRPPVGVQLNQMISQRRLGGPARAEADYIRRLGNIGIATMRGIAMGLQMRGALQERSFFLTEEVAGESLEKLAQRCMTDPSAIPTARDRHEIIRQLALVSRRLHEHDYFHRDLYLCHVFMCRGADGSIALRLIDLARMIERPLMRERWVTKDLAALEYSSPRPLVTRADRLRFLYYYCREDDGRLSEFRLRQTMGRVRRRVTKMAWHDRHRA